METRNTATKRAVFEIMFYLVVIGLAVSLAVFSGFALRGFEEPLKTGTLNINSYLGQYTIYTWLLILSILLVIFPIMNSVFIKKGEKPWTQDKPSWLRIFTVSWIYNPEQSFIWYIFRKNKSEKEVKWLTNVARIIFLSILVFGTLGIFQLFNPQLAVTGTPKIAQQFTQASDIIFGSLIPAVTENGTLLFNLFLLAGVLAFVVAKFVKKEMREPVFWTGFFLIVVPLISFLWRPYHSVAYSNSEASLLATLIFAIVSISLTGIFGIFLFFFFGHFFNNLVLKLLEFVQGKESLTIWYSLILFVILLMYLFFEYRTRKKKKKSAEQMIVG